MDSLGSTLFSVCVPVSTYLLCINLPYFSHHPSPCGRPGALLKSYTIGHSNNTGRPKIPPPLPTLQVSNAQSYYYRIQYKPHYLLLLLNARYLSFRILWLTLSPTICVFSPSTNDGRTVTNHPSLHVEWPIVLSGPAFLSPCAQPDSVPQFRVSTFWHYWGLG
jgi:hypothetical protein